MWERRDDHAFAAPAAEERKVATILFADLVGSTELSGRLDPEALRGIVVAYFDLLAGRIERRGGTVEKFIGDAVMAVFGVPTTHEDDVRRALAAALDIREALVGFNTELERRHGVQLRVRIGINTGEVIATRDPARRQALVSGEVVNLAARLEQHAEPGEILIGADTRTAAGLAAITGDLRALQVKGKSAPLDAYPLVDLLPDDPAATRRFDLPFVGRGRELAALDTARERVDMDGAASLLVLYGDAGIGKTRLLTEWLTRAPAGPVWAVARCAADSSDAGSLRPLRELVPQLLSHPAGGALRERLAAVAQAPLAELYPPLVDLLGALAEQHTVILVLDDTHWASTMLLETVDRLCEDLARLPLLCLCALRPDLSDGRIRLGQAILNYSSVELTALPEEEFGQLASALEDVVAHDSATARVLLERAAGNPLHLEQLAAASHDGHQIGTIPPTIRALIAARLDVLPPNERSLLDIAAVVGPGFAAADLVPLLDGATDGAPDPRQLLRTLTRRRLVEYQPRTGTSTGTHRFANSLIHDVVYEGMTKSTRAGLHARLADLLRAQRVTAGDTGAAGAEQGARIARHLEQAYRCRADLGQRPDTLVELRRTALDELTAAGAAALRVVDLPWAVDLLRRAVQLAQPDDPAQPRALQLYGEVLLAAGERERAREVLAEALARAQAHGASDVATHARLVLSQFEPAAESTEEFALRAAQEFRASGDHLGLARTQLRTGTHHQGLGRYQDSVAPLEEALHQATLAGTDIERANALGALGQSLWLGPLPVPAARQRLAQLLAEHGRERPAVQATLGFPITMLHAAGGDAAAAAAQLAACQEAMAVLGYGEASVFGPLLAGAVAELVGPAGRGVPDLRAAHQAARRLGSATLVRLTAGQLTRALLDAVEPIQALPPGSTPGPDRPTGPLPADFQNLLAVPAPTAVTPADRADHDGLQARVASRRGDYDEALRYARRAIAAAEETDSLITIAAAYLDGARAVYRLDPATARQLARTALDTYRRKGHRVGAGQAALLVD